MFLNFSLFNFSISVACQHLHCFMQLFWCVCFESDRNSFKKIMKVFVDRLFDLFFRHRLLTTSSTHRNFSSFLDHLLLFSMCWILHQSSMNSVMRNFTIFAISAIAIVLKTEAHSFICCFIFTFSGLWKRLLCAFLRNRQSVFLL